MRIIAGELRSRKLTRPPPGVRPTSDRVRESLFTRLGALAGMRVLDLFAGSGALSVEALSRGASEVVCIDCSAPAVAVVRRNLCELGVEDRARVFMGDAVAWARRLARAGERFDVIFVDPPYASDEVARSLRTIAQEGLLSDPGVVVVETAKRHALDPIDGLRVRDERNYGDTVVIWLVRAAEDLAEPAIETAD